MQNLSHHASITETAATEAIFNACRANPAREPRGAVTFESTPLAGGHRAFVRDAAGKVVARADVDEFDI